MNAAAAKARTATESLEEFRVRACAWLDSELAAAEPDLLRGRNWQRRLYDGGWVGLHWPTRYGGHGLTMRHTIAFALELARARAPQPMGAIGLEVVGPTILRYGTDSLRERFLRKLLSGEELWCQGFSEPDAGSDLASLRTTARLEDDHLVLSGHKIWTSWAEDADWCAVLARMDPSQPRYRGIGYLLVDMHSPGVSVRPITQLTGQTEFCELFFDSVTVPPDNVLGGPGEGWRMAMNTLGHERAGYAIRRGMEIRTAFLDFLDAVKGAKRAGPSDAEAIGEVYVLLEVLGATIEDTADRLTNGTVPSPEDSVDKLLLTEAEQALFAVASDFLGAYRAVPVASDLPDGDRWLKGLLYGRAASIYGGSSQIQRSIIAERMLGLPKAR